MTHGLSGDADALSQLRIRHRAQQRIKGLDLRACRHVIARPRRGEEHPRSSFRTPYLVSDRQHGHPTCCVWPLMVSRPSSKAAAASGRPQVLYGVDRAPVTSAACLYTLKAVQTLRAEVRGKLHPPALCLTARDQCFWPKKAPAGAGARGRILSTFTWPTPFGHRVPRQYRNLRSCGPHVLAAVSSADWCGHSCPQWRDRAPICADP